MNKIKVSHKKNTNQQALHENRKANRTGISYFYCNNNILTFGSDPIFLQTKQDMITIMNKRTCTILISFLVLFFAWCGTSFAQKGYLIKLFDGSEIPTREFDVSDNSINYTSMNGHMGFVAKEQVERVVETEDLDEYLELLEELAKKKEVLRKIDEKISTGPPARIEDTPSSVKQTITNPSDCTGSTSQATLLLSLIDNYPWKEDYQIICEWPGDIMIFGYSKKANRLTRMHTLPSGRGGVEAWTDFIMERLKSSSNGGSLNDTPQGNIPAFLQKF